jgi:hypothetical protein
MCQERNAMGEKMRKSMIPIMKVKMLLRGEVRLKRTALDIA